MFVWRFSFSEFGDEAIKCVFGLCYLLCHCPSKCAIIIEGSAKVSDLDWGRGWVGGGLVRWSLSKQISRLCYKRRAKKCGASAWRLVVVGVERPSLLRHAALPRPIYHYELRDFATVNRSPS